MAAEAEIDSSASAGEAAPPKKSKKLLIIIGGAIGLLLALGAGAYFLFLAGPAPSGDAHTVEAPKSFIFNLPVMTVNLKAEADSKESFMKLTVAIEVADESMMKEIQPRMAKVMDAFQVYLRELRKSDLDGSAGIYRLREELRRRINVAIFPAQIESILFREILVQ